MLRPVCAALAGALIALGPATAGAARAAPSAEPENWAVAAVAAPAAWKVTKGSGVTVALLGAGRPDEDLPELKGRVEQAPDLTGRSSDGADVRDEADRRDATAAALIAGGGRDGGVSGIAPEARILAVPVTARLPDLGIPGDTALARGIRYAVNRGASVICVPDSRNGVDPSEREAVAYALSRGVVLVSGVGDGGRTAYARRTGTSYWRFPAGYPGVVGVAAVDRSGRKAPDSSDNLSVLVAAPGVDVPVALPGGGRGTVSGTWAAASIVAGVAALIKARYPDMAPELVSRALTATAHPHPPAGYDDKVGFGVVDAAAALAKAGELAGYGRANPVRDDAHFGNGPLSEAPAPPGPDPIRLGIYGFAMLVGAAGAGIAAVALSRRR